jgi:hypothetical protein
MSDRPDLSFDADGFVRMDELPDLDPELAVAPDSLARLQAALHDEPVPKDVGADWDAMVGQIDRIDAGDSIHLVPDNDGAEPEGDGASGPIVLVEDVAAPGRGTTDFEPEAVGRRGHSSTDADQRSMTERPAPSADRTEWIREPDGLDAPGPSWATDDPLAITPDDPSSDLGALEPVDDLIDVDTVELHHDDDGLPGPSH